MFEDDAEMVRFIRVVLSKEKRFEFNIEVTDRLSEGLQFLTADAIDAVLLDLSLVDSDGLNTFTKVQSQAPEIPIVILTGLEDEELAIQMVQAGAQDYLLKGQTDGKLLVRSLYYAIERQGLLTQLEQQMRRLQTTQEYLHTIITNNADAIIVVAADSTVRFVNPAAEELFGRSSAEFIDNSFGFPITTGETGETTELNIVRRSGGAAIVEMRVVEMEWEGQTAYLATLRDITERKRRQENLIQNRTLQARKLEAAGKLASGIVHEIRTPMQYIRDNTRFSQESCLELFSVLKAYKHLLMMVKEGAATEELVAGIEGEIDAVDLEYICKEMPQAIQQSLEGIEGVTKIVEAMKEFSHPGIGEKVAVDINKNIENTITICRNEWKYVAEIQTDFDPDLPLVSCYPGELDQVILNLIINAAHAISNVVGDGLESKGTIIISTRQDGDWVKICVGDTGTGIPREIQAKIFEPFFTTKEVGKGTGQGLAIAHSVIVDKHGGSITFETEQDKGTVFIISLPVNPEREECEKHAKEILDVGKR